MEKNCRNCLHREKDVTESVCRDCESVNKWEPIPRAPKKSKQENKPQPSLIPMDILIEVLEPAYREGLLKYERESWRKGFLTTEMMDAAMRHIEKCFYEKEDFDKDAMNFKIKKHHLGGAIFSLICMYYSLTRYPDLDDRPKVK